MKRLKILPLFIIVLLIIFVSTFLFGEKANPSETIIKFAEENGISINEYPKAIQELYERNPETKDFVLNYPFEYGKEHKINMEEYNDLTKVPLFIQWDKQWGYLDYGPSVVGLSGCGPICLSMAGYYLSNGDEKFRPDNVVDFAINSGYRINGQGTSWDLISEGAEKLGLESIEISLSETRIKKNLKAGNVVICAMGPGDFTSSGHFIVIAGVEDGKFIINDPNSRERSEKLWRFRDFDEQIKNLWVIRK